MKEQAIFATVLIVLVTGQADFGCVVPGECVNSEFLTVVSVTDIGECISECQVYTFGGEALCNDFTFYDDSDSCFLYENCQELNTECDSCYSGTVESCCYIKGVSCHGTNVGNLFDIDTPEECREACEETNGCAWATHFGDTDICVLTESCDEFDPCDDCTVSSVDNQFCDDEEEPPSVDRDDLVIVVMGGNSEEDYIDNVEVLDLEDSSSCDRELAPLPYAIRRSLGLTTSDGGAPMNCGGLSDGDPRQCYGYDAASDTWVEAAQMAHGRDQGGSSIELSDGTYWVAGGTDGQGTTEFYEGGKFSDGDDLPNDLYYGCTVEIAPGVVFVGGGDFQQDLAYLVDPYSGNLQQELPPMPNERAEHICGAVAAHGGGTDIVVGGGFFDTNLDTVDIYNTVAGVWRPGPTLPLPLRSASYLPYGDSFIVVGGRTSSSNTYSEAVFMYDAEDEDWIELGARLQIPRGYFAIAAANREAVGC